MDLGHLIKLANSATEDAAEARKLALPATVKACRLIESTVVQMLRGEPLRGLKNIGISGEDWYGARVRTNPDTKIDHFNDCTLEDSQSIDTFLIIDSDGTLRYLRWELDTGPGEPYWVLAGYTAPDSYFRIGDVDGMLRALRVVLPRHVQKSQRTAKNYRSAKALTSLVEAALVSQEK